MGKIPQEDVERQLLDLHLSPDAISGIFTALKCTSMDDLGSLLGPDSSAVKDLASLFRLAEGYDISDWLTLDTSVVRGLAYYTGTVFEAFDRSGTLRAICGGGRYDKLLGTFGGEDRPCAGFGFGDAVIVELLKDKELLPDLPHEVRSPSQS